MQNDFFKFEDKSFAVVLKKGAKVDAFNYIINDTLINKNCRLQPFNFITNSKVGKDCLITSSKIDSSVIKNNVKIGPNSNLRPDSVIKDSAKIGNFVEVKGSTVGEHSKVSHMSYIGDGLIGKNCNIGCGTIFCNYDGVKKYKTILKDNVFVGSNTNLVAPITLGKNSLVAAGSTITDNVEENALAIARARQINKQNYKRKQ
jgi:bifunctional UDP-N-acetylglucosamine pyrophosphorylase / glucosamine-1-phosphate N-acetyltransferase